MPDHLNNLVRFWQELKRRRVIHVIVVYASAAFVIIELVNNIYETLNLPEWTPALTLIILAIGFPLAIIFSWIFDVTPEGIEKTKPLEENQKGELSKVSSSWRIATYVSVVIIVGLIAFNIFGGKRGAKIDESLAKSIAVLPFLNLSGDPGQDWICDGLANDIIIHLYKVEAFDKVSPMTSVLIFKNSELNLREIAQELQVNYVLECSYMRMGDELKITAKLIEPKSDNHIWLYEDELPYSEIIGIPGEIAIQIVDHLKVFITKSETEYIQKLSTISPEAFDLLKQATSLILMGTDPERGNELVLQAIELDPQYADAYAIEGFNYLVSGTYSGDKEMQSVQWDALSNFEEALEIDPDNLWAHYGMGLFNEWIRWDYIKAEENLTKVIRLAPSSSDATGVLSHLIEFYTKREGPDEVKQYLNRLDYTPGFGEIQYREIKALLLSNDSAASERLIKTYAESWNERAYKYAGELYIWIGNFMAAKDYLEEAVHVKDREMGTPRFQACLALVYEQTGNPDQAQPIIRNLIDRSDTTSTGSPDFFLGWYYSWIGEADSAFYWLEKAYHNRSAEMPWLKVDPAFRNLKKDDRYWDLYERTGHKAYDDYLTTK